ncbi:JHL25H03.10-LIKE PROTEIN [Salix purpurea]|uniref:JHL25H03.10-LIKE PROTEIN n=1 Tax=Salix purpurea TaxID=77065 RepID=A0A9Q0THE8_SALPP|nr:JHL25H03.10-LIKE PROTEIN [Salix purpurea]
MRFKAGMKVEVLNKSEVATGSWLCAEIISGNGHTYSVKYGWFPMNNDADAVAERVPRKSIRPCPPPMAGDDHWVPGDLVEAFHNSAWKTAIVMEVMGDKSIFVRLLGLCEEFNVYKSHIRVRKCWQDGKWIVMRKGLENYVVPMGKGQSDTGIHLSTAADCFPVEKNFEVRRHPMVSSRTLKRRSAFGSDLETYPVIAQKKRLIEKNGYPSYPSPTFEKVDTIIYPNEILGENYVHSSFHIGKVELSRMDVGRNNDGSILESSISVDTDSCMSSVGSCSAVGSYGHNLCCPSLCDKNLEDLHSDAESSNGSEYEKKDSPSYDEKFGVEVHRSRLHGYCSTVEALYSSGPLSWEDEENLTTLRDELHISDDEHLMVLKKLTSVNSRIVNR